MIGTFSNIGSKIVHSCGHGPVTLLLLSFLAIASGESCIAGSQADAKQNIIDHNCIDWQDRKIPLSYLNSARNLKVYFGHQSVGQNIVEGLEHLSIMNPQRYKVSIAENPQEDFYEANGGLGHASIGENENPTSKLSEFRVKLTQKGGLGQHLDLAVMKFCFVDINENTDLKSLLNEYLSAMQKLKSKFPKLKIVYCTCPLVQNEDNSRREEFNNSLRAYCRKQGQLLFDIADIESYSPQGAVSKQGKSKSLCKIYTEDGQHPNSPAGKQRLAKAWWWLTARVAGWNPKQISAEDKPSEN